MKRNKSLFLKGALAGWIALLIAGCGSDGTSDRFTSENANDALAEAREFYATHPSLPPAVFEAYQRGEISREAIDERIANGEFELFYRFKSPEDIPEGLNWHNGMHLPDLGSPEAIKGGIRFQRLQDFPRTFRHVGPDANGSFRVEMQDWVAMNFAHRHPNVTDIVEDGFEYFPGLAKEWAADWETGTVYVRLFEEATWSDGVPVTVDDMFFTFFMYQNPKQYIRAPWYYNYYNRTYRSLTRFDDHTFALQLHDVKPDLLSKVLEISPRPVHFYSELGDDFVERYQWRYQPTSGAIHLASDNDVRRGRYIRLSRVKDWWAQDMKFWRNRYNYDTIHYSVIRDTAKAFESFRKGELDAFGLALAEFHYDKLPDSDPLIQNGYVSKRIFYNDLPRPTYGLWLNTAIRLLADRDIRVGIQYATHWQRVIDQYFRGDYVRMLTSVDGFGPFTHPTLQPRSFDIDKALEAFARAGFTQRGNDGYLRRPDGTRLSFTLTTGYESLQDILIILKEEAQKAGLEFRVEVLDSTAGWKKVQEKNHEIMFSAFGTFPEMYPRYWETWHSVNAYDQAFLPDGTPNPNRQVVTQTNNLVSMAHPEMDRSIERYRASSDVDEMIALSHRMQEIIEEEAVFSPGFVMPFVRWAAWRWLRFPDDCGVKISDQFDEFHLGWIDEELKTEVQRSMRTGDTFPVEIIICDQYRPQDPS